MDDGSDILNSSDMEFEPEPSKRSNRHPGQASIDQIIQAASEDRLTSKRTAKQLEFGRGAPGTRAKQELWVARFNAYRQYTLKKSLSEPFTGDDVLRFFDSIINKIRPSFRDKPSPGVTLMTNAFQILI